PGESCARPFPYWPQRGLAYVGREGEETMTSQLNIYRQPGIGMTTALETFAEALPGESIVALLYAPSRCAFATVGAKGELSPALANVYELRAFCPTAELRWWNDPSGKREHCSAILAEIDLTAKLSK